LVGSFTGRAKDVFGLEAIINENAPSLFRKMPGASVASKSAPAAPSVAGGISGLQKAASYEAEKEKLYVVNFSTEPTGAALSFDGVPSCPKTPCKVELAGGKVRIIAALEQYERADTTVLIKQNNQSISIKLKSNFGVLEIKPAYLDGIGQKSQWSLTINGKPSSSWENNLSPNKYSVKLSHECYENISFDVGINKGKREVFDMAGNITLKKGGLTLSAERNDEPASEPVFVNGKQVGETPFSGSVPLCARVEIGDSRELVNVKLEYKEKVKHTHSIYTKTFTDKKYRIVYKDSIDNKPEFDNDSDENIIARKEHSEAYKKVFEKARFGTRIGLGYDWLLNEAGNSSLWQFEGGGIAIIPLSKKGPFLFDIELNYIHRIHYTAESISIPLLFQFVIDDDSKYQILRVLEIGAVYEKLLETEFGDKNGIGPAFGAGVRIKNFIIGFRLISYYMGFGGSRLITENLSASYLF